MGAPKDNAHAVGNNGGRPSEYNPSYHPKMVYKLCLLGATNKQIADAFGISKNTLKNWKEKHFEFLTSLTRGKIIADAEIANSLFKRAKGFKHKEKKFFVVRVGKDEDEIQTKDTIKQYPPDTKAAAIWLSNRTKNWRERAGDTPKAASVKDKQAVPQSTPFTIIDPLTNELTQIDIGEADEETT